MLENHKDGHTNGCIVAIASDGVLFLCSTADHRMTLRTLFCDDIYLLWLRSLAHGILFDFKCGKPNCNYCIMFRVWC